ncbi:MAG: transcriptional repressor [Leptospiraceae bacterium]|nr:MAG: transcriptional repressor [Leptospiraceae bacterium]
MKENNSFDIHKELSKFSEFLKKKNLKITSQRLLVAEKIFSIGEHFTVEDLTEILKDKRDEISRATIYRTVSLLVESGQLIEHDFGKNSKYYEFSPSSQEHHDHIVCLDCGIIEEFYNPNIEKIQIEIANKFNYELKDHSLNLYGKCKLLKEKGFCEKQKQSDKLN